eukprot:5257690-Lingulodinium_polyedra.AAC.1
MALCSDLATLRTSLSSRHQPSSSEAETPPGCCRPGIEPGRQTPRNGRPRGPGPVVRRGTS